LPNAPKSGSADRWTIILSVPSGRVRYIRSLHRLAALLDDAWTPAEKLAYDNERQASEPPSEALEEVKAIRERQMWQRRYLAAEAAARRPVQRPKLNLPTATPDTKSTTQEDSHVSSDQASPGVSASLPPLQEH
jgi:hypothetical protein